MEFQVKEKKSSLGLYLHVPFCASTCDFCAFYQEKPKREWIENYLAGIEQEIEKMRPNRSIDTVFFGGGTPGLLPASDLERLGNAVLSITQGKPVEWTVEMAPSVVKIDKLEALKRLGVTRISMGVQSFQEGLLNSLGRLHSPKQVYQAYDRISQVGFKSVNLDLIFAIPGQDWAMCEQDLLEAVRLNPDHISTYCLTFEEDTALYIKLGQGKVKIDREREIELYKNTWSFLEDHGYGQYEISNFSKTGHSCVHNVNTWEMHEWIGVGPSAASQYAMERYANTSSLETWLKNIQHNPIERVDYIQLDSATLATDALIFGLRMNRGIDLKELQKRFLDVDFSSLESLWKRFVDEKYLVIDGEKSYLTLEGRLMADAIGASIFEAM